LQRSGLSVTDLFSFSYAKHGNQNAGTDHKCGTQNQTECGRFAECDDPSRVLITVKIYIVGAMGLWYNKSKAL